MLPCHEHLTVMKRVPSRTSSISMIHFLLVDIPLPFLSILCPILGDKHCPFRMHQCDVRQFLLFSFRSSGFLLELCLSPRLCLGLVSFLKHSHVADFAQKVGQQILSGDFDVLRRV